LPSRKAIAEVTDSGDRPDALPLEERGNAVFSDAANDTSGTLLISQSFGGSARMQVWDAETATLARREPSRLGMVAGSPHAGRRVYARRAGAPDGKLVAASHRRLGHGERHDSFSAARSQTKAAALSDAEVTNNNNE
jgi:hypothetical protein